MKRSTMDIILDLTEKYGKIWDIIRYRSLETKKLTWAVRIYDSDKIGEWHDFKTVRQLENFLNKETQLLKASERRMN